MIYQEANSRHCRSERSEESPGNGDSSLRFALTLNSYEHAQFFILATIVYNGDLENIIPERVRINLGKVVVGQGPCAVQARHA